MRCLVKENLNLDGLSFKSDYPEPKVERNDVKIKVLAAGICGTDKGIFNSSKNEGIRKEMLRYCKDGAFRPLVIGHEFCGVVAGLGAGLTQDQPVGQSRPFRIEVGDYVTAEAHLSCGYCTTCRTGSEHLCVNIVEKGIHQYGTFAEYITVPFRNVILLGKGGVNPAIPPKVGAILDAFGNAVHLAEEGQVAGKTVAVLGAGPIGLMTVAVLHKLGAAKIFVSDAFDVERKFGIATALGADHCFDVSQGSASMHSAIARSISSTANGVDVVMEISGAASAYDDAFKLVRNGGQVLLLGLPPKPIAQFDFSNSVIFKGITIKGIFGRKMFSTWNSMVQLLSEDRYDFQSDLKRIVSEKTYALSDYQTAFKDLSSGQEMKIVFDCTTA